MALDPRPAPVARHRARFVRERLAPAEAEVAENDAVPPDIIAEMRELGLFGLSIPEGTAGSASRMEDEVQVAVRAGPRPRRPSARCIGTNNRHRQPGHRDRRHRGAEARIPAAPRLAARSSRSFALTEPDAGSDAASAPDHARVRDGDD